MDTFMLQTAALGEDVAFFLVPAFLPSAHFGQPLRFERVDAHTFYTTTSWPDFWVQQSVMAFLHANRVADSDVLLARVLACHRRVAQ